MKMNMKKGNKKPVHVIKQGEKKPKRVKPGKPYDRNTSYDIGDAATLDLYLTCLGARDAEGSLTVPLETLTVLFVIQYAKLHENQRVKIHLVQDPEEKTDDTTAKANNGENISLEENDVIQGLGIKIRLPDYASVISDRDVPGQAKACQFPVIAVPEKQLCITGICSVLRFLQKVDGRNGQLLGFQGTHQHANLPD